MRAANRNRESCLSQPLSSITLQTSQAGRAEGRPS